MGLVRVRPVDITASIPKPKCLTYVTKGEHEEKNREKAKKKARTERGKDDNRRADKQTSRAGCTNVFPEIRSDLISIIRYACVGQRRCRWVSVCVEIEHRSLPQLGFKYL